MTDTQDSEKAVTPDIIPPEEAATTENRPMRRASDLKFAALDYEHADFKPLPAPDAEPAPSLPETGAVKELPPPAETEPAAAEKPQPQEEGGESEPPLRGILIPPMLSWVLGFMSLVLFLVADGLLMTR